MRDKKYLEKLGENIANARKKMNLTQEEFAEKSEIDRSSLARIESGKVNSTINKLREIASALNMKIEDLVKVD
ncbi:MAG: helix-turn-helix transcriptional regulator [Flavobacteriales bacterium]|nr:helix-turn-helix transcriptional regulator [Flavobacteriales bacterium]